MSDKVKEVAEKIGEGIEDVKDEAKEVSEELKTVSKKSLIVVLVIGIVIGLLLSKALKINVKASATIVGSKDKVASAPAKLEPKAKNEPAKEVNMSDGTTSPMAVPVKDGQ